MQTFRNYLTEKWGKGMWIKTKPSNPAKKLLTREVVHHEGKVGNHTVHVYFDKQSGKHTIIDFSVDHSFQKGEFSSPPEHGHEILKHAHNVISNYIKRKKPHSISMVGNTNAKDNLYHRYAKHLAKTHNGEYSYDYPGHVVTFPQNHKK